MLKMNYLGEQYPYANEVTYYLDSKNDKELLKRLIEEIFKKL